MLFLFISNRKFDYQIFIPFGPSLRTEDLACEWLPIIRNGEIVQVQIIYFYIFCPIFKSMVRVSLYPMVVFCGNVRNWAFGAHANTALVLVGIAWLCYVHAYINLLHMYLQLIAVACL